MADELNANARKILDACEDHWEAHKSDCSGFVRAVASAVGVTLSGQADEIVGIIQGEGWTKLGHDGITARTQAEAGWLVIGGLKGADQATPSTNGHVVVVVPGELAHGKYPTAYWGKLHGTGKKKTTLNWAWRHADLANVVFGARPL